MEQNKIVLVVDDDKDLLGMVEMVMLWAGYEVTTAGEGSEALAKVAQKMPDLILLDMKMPGMDGWQFAREFRAKHGRAAPIIVMTAAEDAKKRAEEICAEGYLGKPFNIDDLIDIVKRHTGQDRGF